MNKRFVFLVAASVFTAHAGMKLTTPSGQCVSPQTKGTYIGLACPDGKFDVTTSDFEIKLTGPGAATATLTRWGFIKIGDSHGGPDVLVDFRFSGALSIDDTLVEDGTPVRIKQGQRNRFQYALTAVLGSDGGTNTAGIIGFTAWSWRNYGKPDGVYTSAVIVPIPEPSMWFVLSIALGFGFIRSKYESTVG